MEQSSSAGPQATGAQRNSVEIFLNALEKSIRSARVYAYESGQQMLESIYDNTVNCLDRALSENDEIEVTVKPFEMTFERRTVYSNKERKSSLSFALYQDGIRLITFKKGFTKEELIETINLLATDFTRPDRLDEDLFCLFTERDLPHLEVTGSDLITEFKNNKPEEYQKMMAYVEGLKRKKATVTPSQPRKLRSDDLKVLEEFRLNPLQFNRSDEEVSKAIQTIALTREGAAKERETLERLLVMGFHFLLAERSPEQVQVGRELVSKIALMVLEEAHFDLFDAVVTKIQQLQKERTDQSGELQKILDTVFHVDQFPLFKELLAHPEKQKHVLRVFSHASPSSVRLIICLLGSFPQLTKTFAEFVLKNLPSHMSWLLEEATKRPESESWEQVINILSLRPTAQFQKFLEVLLATPSQTVRVKVLRQLASIGSPEALRFFLKMFESKDEAERIQAYEFLSASKNKNAVKLLKMHLDSEAFLTSSAQEREVGYTCVIQVAGEATYPWIEQLWMLPGTGLFKKKAETERRLVLLRACARSNPAFIEKLLQKTPLETLVSELREAIEKITALRRSSR